MIRWRYDVRPINGFNQVNTSSVAKVVNDTLMLHANVIIKYLEDAREVVADVVVYGQGLREPTEQELFYIRESVLKLIEMVHGICQNCIDFTTLYEKEVFRKLIEQTSAAIYNYIKSNWHQMSIIVEIISLKVY